MEYTPSGKLKMSTYIMIFVGIIALALGFVNDHTEHHNAFWANLLLNGFFFMTISLAATFFIAVQYAAEAAWAVVFKRIFEALMAFLPYGGIVVTLVLAMNSAGVAHMYHWMDPDVMDPNSEHYDALIAMKKPYLNQVFFWVRTIIYLAGWIYFARYFRKKSLEEDQVGGEEFFWKNRTMSAIFLVFFGFSEMFAVWDWVMSIDVHWHSNLYHWYLFATMWLAFIALSLLITYYLKGQGHLKEVNHSHLHDLGKWLFAIGLLWAYFFYAQFLLIWYADMPEETVYFKLRIKEYGGLFFGTALFNFFVPFWVLMSRDAKRNPVFVVPVAILLFISHFITYWLVFLPSATGGHDHLSLTDMGIFIGFLGAFLLVTFNALAKAPLIVKNHPYLEESKHLHI
jgi:hypothetical protein